MFSFILLALLAPNPIPSENEYSCITDQMTGFIHQESGWNLVSITPENEYVIFYSADEHYRIRRADVEEFDYYCPQGFNKQGILFCNGFSPDTTYDTFVFNKNSKRFTFSNVSFSYTFVGTDSQYMEAAITENNADGSVVAIGKCKPTK